MLLSMTGLAERIAKYTIPGPPDECWGWSASRLQAGYARLAVRRSGERVSSITAVRAIVHLRDGLPIEDHTWVARHTCDNRRCVNPGHIESGTHAENTADMWSRGRGAYGDRRPSAKLSAEKVREIRELLASGVSQAKIAKAYGVEQTNVSAIKRGRIWAWVQ